MKNTVIITIVSILLIIGFFFGAYKLTSNSTPAVFPEVSKITAGDHVTWSTQKKHILVEYSDLQCPACKNFHDYIQQDIVNTPKGKVDLTKSITFVYRHFPLTDLHPHAREAAQAAEAAGKQGKFYEYANKLFATQPEWESLPDTKNYFLTLAKDLKLDTDRFTADMNSKEVNDHIDQNYDSGVSFTVNATPTFFIDGKKIENLQSFEEFRQILEDVVKAKSS